MATSPDPRTLQWLSNVLKPSYADPGRTYHDIAATIAFLPSLRPCTKTFTHNDGRSELLLQLYGTLPVLFCGSDYRFPVVLWVPLQYPHEPPIAFVEQAEDTMIRPGNHIDPAGQIYHPYLAHWAGSGRSNLVDLCKVLREVFAREPPLISRQAPPMPVEAPPPVPPLPPELDGQSVRTSPHQLRSPQAAAPPGSPSVPPLPPKVRQAESSNPSKGGSSSPLLPQEQGVPSRYDRPLPLPPTPRRHIRPQASPVAHLPHSPVHRPEEVQYHASRPHQSVPDAQYARAYPRTTPSPRPVSFSHPPPEISQQRHPSPSVRPASVYGGAIPQHASPSPASRAPRSTPTFAPVNLLDDPSDVLPPATQIAPAAPPLPPNPEKDRLIREITEKIHQRAQETAEKTREALEAAAGQKEALLRAEANMEDERLELDRIVDVCEKDREILRERIAMAERRVDEIESKEVPGADEVVVGTTVVHTQLYDLVTDDMAIEDTIYVLGQALDKERIGLDVFLKHARTLAREQFMKRALAKKIQEQLALE